MDDGLDDDMEEVDTDTLGTRAERSAPRPEDGVDIWQDMYFDTKSNHSSQHTGDQFNTDEDS
ncbi:hypothetical protein NX059_012153 [Plenodomus lindquistii]|nr:hypothetical protein NX059_012153 [Plenodomus lindquistii]